MLDLCVECKEPVLKLQHGITCQMCNRRQHRTCNTGVSRIELFKARKNLILLDFMCPWCEANTYPNSPGNGLVPEPNSTRVVYDESFEVDDFIDTKADMDACIGSQTPNKSYKFKPFPGTTNVMPSIMGSADDVVLLGTTFVIPPGVPVMDTDDPIDNTFMIDDSSFDVRDICPDLPPFRYNRSATIDDTADERVAIEKGVTFEVIEGGTMRNKKKLVSSDGYSYGVKRVNKRSVSWKCSLRTRANTCPAAVAQRGDNFTRGRYNHTHLPDPLVKKKTILQSELRRDAMIDSHRPARRLVNIKLNQLCEEDRELIRPQTDSLIRIVNRTRQKIRSQLPETNTQTPASSLVNTKLTQVVDDEDDFIMSPNSGVFRKVNKPSQKTRSQHPKTLRNVFDDDDDFILSPSSGLFRKVNTYRQKIVGSSQRPKTMRTQTSGQARKVTKATQKNISQNSKTLGNKYNFDDSSSSSSDSEEDSALSQTSGLARKGTKATQKNISQRLKTLGNKYNFDDSSSDSSDSEASGLARNVTKTMQKNISQHSRTLGNKYNLGDTSSSSSDSSDSEAPGLARKVTKTTQKNISQHSKTLGNKYNFDDTSSDSSDSEENATLSQTSGLAEKVTKVTQKNNSQHTKTLRNRNNFVDSDDDDFTLSQTSGLVRKVNRAQQKMSQRPKTLRDDFTRPSTSGPLKKGTKVQLRIKPQQSTTQRIATTETQIKAHGSVNTTQPILWFDSEEDMKRMKRNLIRMVYRVRKKMRSQLAATQN